MRMDYSNEHIFSFVTQKYSLLDDGCKSEDLWTVVFPFVWEHQFFIEWRNYFETMCHVFRIFLMKRLCEIVNSECNFLNEILKFVDQNY